jgi:hypothetical protein
VALGDRRGRVRDRRRSVGRRVLIIGRQARSPETRDALVHSYRRLMATTRAVIRDAATMGRRISQRLRTASRPAATGFMNEDINTLRELFRWTCEGPWIRSGTPRTLSPRF